MPASDAELDAEGADRAQATGGSDGGVGGVPDDSGDEGFTPLLEVGDDLQILASNDEWAFRKADALQKRLPQRTGGPDRKTEGEVFDRPTLLVLHRLLTHGVLKSLDFPISTGKEANVFRGTTPGGGLVAVKIYRVNTATFKHVLQYIQGDERFAGVSGDKRGLVHAWCQKEFRNLVRLRESGVAVPEPLKALSNVLVMEYLGTRQGPWPRLQELRDLDLETATRLGTQVLDDVVRSYNEAELVHADLSEYNILVENTDQPPAAWRARLIDVGQAVLKTHPMARQFLDRDVQNLVRFLRRKGVSVTAEDVMSRLVHETKSQVGRHAERHTRLADRRRADSLEEE